jgi:predicted O-methyltransferase YrrM
MFWKKPSLKSLLPPPVKANHAEYSMILSLHDDPARPTPSLIELSLRAIEHASRADLSELSARFTHPPVYSEIWPGEHYKLLAGITEALQPAVIIEIGTATGLSALAMKKYLPKTGKIASFDLAPWQRSYPNSHLKPEDFADGRLVQYAANLAESSVMEKYAPLIQEADLIFIDATHDGELEKKLLNQLQQIGFKKKVYILFDDIRVWTMLKMWREISLPKIDLTSFGHWSGTGLVELDNL